MVKQTVLFELQAISPLDGRYRQRLQDLASLCSEEALIKQRVFVELQYLRFLSEEGVIPKLSQKEKRALKDIQENVSSASAIRVKEIEEQIKHDVKAVEYFIQEELEKRSMKRNQFIHIGLTSEDTNAIAYGIMLSEVLEQVLIPIIQKLVFTLNDMAFANKDVVMLARTHGQPAVPTTFGKELMVFAMRLHEQLLPLSNFVFEAKMTGAVGNFNAHVAAFPREDWKKLSSTFIASFGLRPNLFTTQILPAESYVEFFQILGRINMILLDFTQDMWRYISDEYVLQKMEEHQVGSSTMPQKINPIEFENCEGNLGLANALLQLFANKLPISRLQRDLSDSTVKRNIGPALGYCVLAYTSCLRGLNKITPNTPKMLQDLEQHWEIIAEGVQTILRATGDEQAYEKLKTFSQGKKLTKEDFITFIFSLKIHSQIKKKLLQLSPATYVGIASKLVTEGYKKIQGATYGKRTKI